VFSLAPTAGPDRRATTRRHEGSCERGENVSGHVEAIPTTGPPIVLVGYVHGFPRHPEPGAAAEPLMAGYDVRPGVHSPDETYALVSVDHGAHLWRLNGRQLARGHRNAVLPPSVTALGAPEEVPIDDQPL
jgi:hypothetical protein